MTLSAFEVALLEQSQRELSRAIEHLERSLVRTSTFDPSTTDADELDLFEALTSRFARVSDILIRKVLRLIMKIQTDDGGSIIDFINYAEKIGIVDSAEEFERIRRTRNTIAHDYAWEMIAELVLQVRIEAPELLRAARRATEFR